VPAVSASRYMVQAGWDDSPHLDERTKRELLESTPPFLRDARSKGSPSLGAGAIYPLEQSAFTVEPFAIPPHWAKGYGSTWAGTAPPPRSARTTAIPTSSTSIPSTTAARPSPRSMPMRSRRAGRGSLGAIDPAANGRAQKDGEQLIANYRTHGLNLINADNTVEAGILEVWQMLSSGRLKVFTSCTNWLAEHRLYRRDEQGRIVKQLDHLMDATRYLIRTRGKMMKTQPVAALNNVGDFHIADKIGGY
jgi:hypothetical protein